ncbi:MAG: MFS transporter [Chloroflexi bacterium]|nr:MFS transporter [Chloroflexota bacterium]
MPIEKPKVFYGYIIVAAGFSSMMIVHGTFNAFGVFFRPLQEEFGSSRATLSGASSLAFIIMGFIAILMGALADRFGPRVVMTVCGILFGVAHILMALTSSIWQVYLFYLLVGIGLGAFDVVPLSTVVRWFAQRRGMMSGIMKVGTGLGMMAVPLITSNLIASYGWRTSYILLGTLVLVTAIPLAQLLRRDPYQKGLILEPKVREHAGHGSSGLKEEGLSWREGFHTYQLWIVSALYLIIMFTAQTILVHIVPHAEDLGISSSKAAGLIAVIGGASMLGRLTMGMGGDRIGNKRALMVCFAILILALSWLQWSEKLWMLYIFTAIYGFSHGGFFALMSPTVAGLFGTRSQGTLLGIVLCTGTFGGAVGPFVTGVIFDVTASYKMAFFMLLSLVSLGLALTALLRPVKSRAKEMLPVHHGGSAEIVET